MSWKPLNTYLKLIETKFPIKNGRNIPQLNIAIVSAILNPGHDENAKPEAAPTTLYLAYYRNILGLKRLVSQILLSKPQSIANVLVTM